MRTLNPPRVDATPYLLPIHKGGVGGTTPEQAAQALGVLTKDLYGAPNGIAVMPEGGIGREDIEGTVNDPNVPVLNGPSRGSVMQDLVYQIVNFDTFTTYVIQATNGTVTRDGDLITLRGVEAGDATLTVNGVKVVVAIGEGYVRTPSILLEQSYLGARSAIFASSPFVMVGGEDLHVGSDWQVSTDVGFSQVVYESLGDGTNLLSWSIENMQPDTQYYVRVRHRGENGGESEWSDPVAFKTAQEGGFEETGIWYGPAASSYFGRSVSLSADGNTALVGAYGWNGRTGKVLTYTRNGNTWTYQADLPHALGQNSYFGWSVSLSADGNTALVGAHNWNSGTGKVLVYTRSGSTWTQQADLPHALGASSYFGQSVSLPADGNTALVGAYNWNSGIGKALVYTRSGGTWTLLRELDNPLGSGQFGYAVALSGDTSVALIGAPNHNSATGFVAVYE